MSSSATGSKVLVHAMNCWKTDHKKKNSAEGKLRPLSCCTHLPVSLLENHKTYTFFHFLSLTVLGKEEIPEGI
jgi:hypothetical protein